MNTNIMNFYLQHLYYELSPEKMSDIYVYDTTFFSVLSGENGLNFFDKEIIAALKNQ